MKKNVLINILINLAIAIVFVLLNNNALKNELEETFVSLAIIYGIIVVFVNAFFIARVCKK